LVGTTVSASTSDTGYDADASPWDGAVFDNISYGNIVTLDQTIPTVGSNIINFYQSVANPNYRNMNLVYVTDWAAGYKTLVGQGDTYGHVYSFKDNA